MLILIHFQDEHFVINSTLIYWFIHKVLVLSKVLSAIHHCFSRGKQFRHFDLNAFVNKKPSHSANKKVSQF